MGNTRTLDEWRALWDAAVSATGTGEWETDIDYPGTDGGQVLWGALSSTGAASNVQVRVAGWSEYEEVVVLLAAVLADLPKLLDHSANAVGVAQLAALRADANALRADVARRNAEADLERANAIIREAYQISSSMIGALLERSGMELPEAPVPQSSHHLSLESHTAWGRMWRCSSALCIWWAGPGDLTHADAVEEHNADTGMTA